MSVIESEAPSLPAVELLLSWGANDFKNAVALAAYQGRLQLMQLFRNKCLHQCKERINGADYHSFLKNALMAAVGNGQIEAVRLVLEWHRLPPTSAGLSAKSLVQNYKVFTHRKKQEID